MAARESVNTPRTFVQSFIYLSPVQIYIGRVFSEELHGHELA